MRFNLTNSRIINDVNNGVVDRGDEFDVVVQANGNGDTQTRQLLFDVQFDISNFDIVSINHTGTSANGGILPLNSNPQLSFQNYPGYGYAGNTTSTNGTTRYQSGLGYTFTSGGPNSIIRILLTWASTTGVSGTSPSQFIIMRFRVKPTSTANSFNPVRLNFVAGFNSQGTTVPTIMDSPLSAEVILNQNTGKFVTAKVDANSNLLNLSNLRVSFRDTLTNTGPQFNVLANGNVDINQSLLAENRVYEVAVMHELDKLNAIYNGAITISDFTSAQGEILTMGLLGTKGEVINTGQSLYAADINRNKSIDLGDLP